MITLKALILRGVALPLITVALVSSANAQELSWRQSAAMQHRISTFDVSGVYSGTPGGQLVIGGTAYRLDESLQIYMVGVGMVPLYQVPVGSHVYASGDGAAGSGTIRALIARPGIAETTDTTYPSPRISVKSPSAPR